MNGSELILEVLWQEGVRTIFGLPGASVISLYDALPRSGIKHVLVRHEQAAAFAADAFARVTGGVGVCVATSGPGATNLLTGIANAYLDSVPLVAITGQVASGLIGSDGFQEVDTVGMTLPFVKHSFLAESAEELRWMAPEVLWLARSGRPGPVLLDIPKDVLSAQVEGACVPRIPRKQPNPPVEQAVREARALLAASRRPVLWVGGGVVAADAACRLREFSALTGIPVVTSLKGLGVMTPDFGLYLGMLGMHGSIAANLAVQECDLLIAAGVRFGDRTTGRLSGFAPEAKVIHLDIDEAEPGKIRHADVALLGDIGEALFRLGMSLEIDEWRARCLEIGRRASVSSQAPAGMSAQRFIRLLSERLADDSIICCDVGQHQMWVAQHYSFREPRRHLTSGGLGAMGYGLPAAIGAKFARPESTVVAISGDGSIMMNIQELATVRRYGLPLSIVVFDNHGLGMVRQWQDLFFEGRRSETDLADNPDFAAVARAFGIEGISVENETQMAAAVERIASGGEALLVHVVIDAEERVWPLVPAGKVNSEMLEGTV